MFNVYTDTNIQYIMSDVNVLCTHNVTARTQRTTTALHVWYYVDCTISPLAIRSVIVLIALAFWARAQARQQLCACKMMHTMMDA